MVSESPPPGSARRPCPCAHQEASRLKPAYAEVLESVHQTDQPIASFAARAGLTVNNATVRLHRARRALRERVLDRCGACADDGCHDCDCAETRLAL
jgi:RNA polymerase sigma-70 factor (ECF subfamily)